MKGLLGLCLVLSVSGESFLSAQNSGKRTVKKLSKSLAGERSLDSPLTFERDILERKKREASPEKKDSSYNSWSFDARSKNKNGVPESTFLGHTANDENPEGVYYLSRKENPSPSSRKKRYASPQVNSPVYNTWSFDSRSKSRNGVSESAFLGHAANNENPEGVYYFSRRRNPPFSSRQKRYASPQLNTPFYNTWSYDSRFSSVNGNSKSSTLGYTSSNTDPDGQYYYAERNHLPDSNSRRNGFLVGGGFSGGFRWGSKGNGVFPENPETEIEVFDPVTPIPSVPSVTPVK